MRRPGRAVDPQREAAVDQTARIIGEALGAPVESLAGLNPTDPTRPGRLPTCCTQSRPPPLVA